MQYHSALRTVAANLRLRRRSPRVFPLLPVMWSETVGLRTRPVSDQIIGLVLGLAGLVLFCGTRSCHARRHNDLEGHRNFCSRPTIYSFSILCLEHHYCGVQQWRSHTSRSNPPNVFVYFRWSWSWSCKQPSWSWSWSEEFGLVYITE